MLDQPLQQQQACTAADDLRMYVAALEKLHASNPF
jgi:hypothetical protein